MRFVGLAALVSGCLAAGAASGDPFPLTEGILWHYEVTYSDHVTNDVRSFLGTAELNSTTTHVLHYAGGDDDGLQQYWSQDAGGDVYFHGFDRPGLSAHYSPAILWIDVPLFVGKTWDAATVTPFAINFHFEVLAEEDVTVPAGTFHCFTVAWSTPFAIAAKLAGRDALGRGSRTNGTPTGYPESYADGTGLVQGGLGLYRTERLTAIGPDIVAVVPTTWTGIRQLYR